MITEIQYQGLKIRAATEERIMFITHETILASDDTKMQQGIECLLEKKDDGQWRLVQQHILSDDETYKLPQRSLTAILNT